MGRRLLASLAATAAVAASLLIGSAGSATAADTTAQSASTADARGSDGVTPNANLKDKPIYVDETKFKIVATLRGVGKQIYDCSGGTATLPAREPAAVLSALRGAPVGIHGKGPFWTHFDGSRVDGSAPVSAPAPDPAKNIPWLKLTATPTGSGVFGKVAFIQRLDTRGGVAPATCGVPTVAVDYSANYVFWAPK
jgi:hypothetical protein